MSNIFTLNQRYNSLISRIIKATPHNEINTIRYTGSNLIIDCTSLFFLSFHVNMISDITSITFLNALPNGIYNIYLYVDKNNHTFYKNQGNNLKNNLYGDSIFQANNIFCINVNYDGINFFMDIQLFN